MVGPNLAETVMRVRQGLNNPKEMNYLCERPNSHDSGDCVFRRPTRLAFVVGKRR